MNVLITGAAGFLGKNLAVSLQNIKNGKDRTHPSLDINEIYLYDMGSSQEELNYACEHADFVFNLAGVNRPKDNKEFIEGNFGFASMLIDTLKRYNNKCPVLLSSSIQASLEGHFSGSEYGKTKLAGEDLFFKYGEETGVKVLVYRFPNLFGKWSKPNYNSVVATFCNNIAKDLPIQVNDRSTELELLYIDDLVADMLAALEGRVHRCIYDGAKKIPCEDGKYCHVLSTYKVTLGKIIDLLESFNKRADTIFIPELPEGSFEKKLYSMYLSYLPKEKMSLPLNMNVDARGSFTELFKTEKCGQFSISISEPGATKGQHWHHSKWEYFIVVSGHGLIQERRLDTDEIIEFEVSGDRIEAVLMLPGYSHNIINLSEKEKLVTVMWANEVFDSNHPDTYREEV